MEPRPTPPLGSEAPKSENTRSCYCCGGLFQPGQSYPVLPGIGATGSYRVWLCYGCYQGLKTP